MRLQKISLTFFKSLRLFAVILLVFTLAACLGGGGDPGSDTADYSPKVVMDGSGNAVLVANRSKVGEKYGVYVSHYTPGGEWEDFCCLNDTSAGVSAAENTEVAIAMDASGSAIAVYHIIRQDRNVYTRRYVPGGPDDGWGAEVSLDSDSTEMVYIGQNPKVAMDGSGNGVALWWRDGYMYANYYTPGSGWEGSQIIGAGYTPSPDAAMVNDGSALVVWEKYDPATTTFRVYMNRYVPGSGWQTEEPVSSEQPYDAYDRNPRIATNTNTPTQMAVITWESGDNIYARRYVGGIPEGEVLVGSGNIPRVAQSSGYHPTVAMDANGNAITVWNGYDGTNYNISASRYVVADGVWQTPEVIATSGITPIWSSTALAMDSAGNATALVELENVITAIRYIAGSGWQEPLTVETSNRDEGRPSIAMDDSGITIAAWDGKNADSDARIIYTRVWEGWDAPIASFSFTPNSPNVDEAVDFDASDSTDDGTIDLYEWDFDYDGATFDVDATGVTASHAYNVAGGYTVALRVTDDSSLTDETTQTVTVSGGGDPDTFTLTVIGTITVGDQPSGIGVSPETNRIYVANTNSDNLSVINGLSNGIMDTIEVGDAPVAVGINSIENLIYVANSNSHNMSVIDGSTHEVVATIELGNRIIPSEVAVNPETNLIYVGNSFGTSISVIDGGSIGGAIHEVVTIEVGDTSRSIDVNPVTNLVYAVTTLTGVTVIDGETREIDTTIDVGLNPGGVEVNPITNRIYVTNTTDDTITVINGSTNEVITTVAVGSNPVEMGINIKENHIYVANSVSGEISGIDGVSNEVKATVSVNGFPNDVGVNPDTNRIYITDNISTVTVIAVE